MKKQTVNKASVYICWIQLIYGVIQFLVCFSFHPRHVLGFGKTEFLTHRLLYPDLLSVIIFCWICLFRHYVSSHARQGVGYRVFDTYKFEIKIYSEIGLLIIKSHNMSVTVYYFLSQILKIPHSTWILIWMSDFFLTFVFTSNFCSALIFPEYVSCKLQVTSFLFGFLFSPDLFQRRV